MLFSATSPPSDAIARSTTARAESARDTGGAANRPASRQTSTGVMPALDVWGNDSDEGMQRTAPDAQGIASGAEWAAKRVPASDAAGESEGQRPSEKDDSADRENLVEAVRRTRNDVNPDQLADAAGGRRPGVGRGLH